MPLVILCFPNEEQKDDNQRDNKNKGKSKIPDSKNCESPNHNKKYHLKNTFFHVFCIIPVEQ